jgi:hypothetical protein
MQKLRLFKIIKSFMIIFNMSFPTLSGNLSPYKIIKNIIGLDPRSKPGMTINNIYYQLKFVNQGENS